MKKLSTLFFALTIFNAAYAQIPNPGFENWTSHGAYSTPDGWGNLDSLGGLNPSPVYPCTQGTPGYTGSSYLKLTSQTTLLGVIPGIAVSGTLAISGTSFSVNSGIPMSTRPQSLTGAWQYMASGSDQGYISVLLTKWNMASNQRDTISYTNQPLAGMAMSWATFSIDLNYLHGAVPDTGIILLSSGKTTGGTAGSYLYVDSLGFAGSVPNGVISVSNNTNNITLSPNPASQYTDLSYGSRSAGDATISIIGINGNLIKEMHIVKSNGVNNFKIDLSSLSAGIYFIKVIDNEGVLTRKLIVE